jgi:hypothetical protein
MTRDDVIRWAREAGLPDPMVFAIGYERLVLRTAAAEREECAKVADEISNKYAFGYYGQEVDTADEIAAAIRARKPV